MDYEKKYKEALERAIKFLNKELFVENSECAIKHIFPELAESKDEKVRKTLIRVLNENVGNGIEKYGTKLEDALAWLEKRGEQETLCDKCKKAQPSHSCSDITALGRCYLEHEKQCEQKVPVADFKAKDWYVSKVDGKIHNIYHSVDKVEPKFKVGDRVNKNDREDEEHCILTITSVNIDEHCYICDQCSVIDFGEQDLWHIVEQKPAWSEEDEIGLSDALWAIGQARTIAKDENDMGNLWYAERWLKSLKERMEG